MARTTSQPRPHALAQALHRSAGFAVLRPASRPQLDVARILTMSGTLAINLIALGMLMMPLAMPPPATSVDEPHRNPVVREVPKDKPVVVEIVDKIVKPAPVAQQVKPQTVAPALSETSSVVVISETGSEQVADNTISEDIGPATDFGTATSNAPTAMQLEYLSAPPPGYPRGALSRRIEGTVLLQVLVGIDGRPLDVTVSQSSGNRELDEAARSQILKRWSFRPAMKNGQAVQALGLVPIAFNIRN
ncbi:MAG: TonB family protein [Thermomonas sp.]